MNVQLVRFLDDGDATAGTLLLDERRLCFSLEDTGKKQGDGIYRIPAGDYTIKKVISEKFGPTYTILGVPGHDLLRVHWGNSSLDTRGCVLTGFQLDMSSGLRLGMSKVAFRAFMIAMQDIPQAPFSIREKF